MKSYLVHLCTCDITKFYCFQSLTVFSLNQAKNEDLQTDYDHMKKSFDRLKEDHTKLDTEHRQNYKELKEKNEKIMVALQSEC